MIGLLLKDILVLRRQLRALPVVAAIYLLAGLVYDGMDLAIMSYVLVTLALMYPVSTLAYDDHAGWHGYCRALPVPVSTEALSKYLLGLVCVAAGFLTSALMLLLAGALHGEPPGLRLTEALPGLLGALAGVLLVFAAMFPLSLKLGVERARLWMFLLMALPVAVLVLLPEIGAVKSDWGMLLWLTPVIILTALAVSWRTACKLYAKKES